MITEWCIVRVYCAVNNSEQFTICCITDVSNLYVVKCTTIEEFGIVPCKYFAPYLRHHGTEI